MKTIVGIVGFKNSGKDTAAQCLINNFNFKKDSFANSLKDTCASIFCWDREMLEGDTAEQRAQREIVDPWWAEKLGIRDWSPRKALQHVGTEIMRHNLHPTLWALSVEKRLLSGTCSKMVYTDTRFNNEISLLKKYNAKIVRIKRGPEPDWFDVMYQYNRFIYYGIVPENHEKITKEAEKIIEEVHASERDWIGTDLDVTIENDGTIQDLWYKTEQFAKEILK